ncbi:nuclear pore complex protein Nup93-like [Anneissia japonica]|uniref:nuclear pore complex protein Nup93-like n=1 Tax=Anneissia japonica TaxID=1529436 RepID=UPI001425AFB8|nr:nuclear pore complex protein Nup93-like [Anneissia japonica]XP_033102121.1 nuclear pore complex protein Nup93-like [Anneissia japonica]XP_033102129.1 nuclear pore complex protein Nup93-like [Anneissia japonica]
MEMEGFEDLLQQAEQLTADVDSGSDLPRVERNIHQIVEAGQRLWSRTAQTGQPDTANVKASILLGSKGLDVPKISQRLETLSATRTLEPLEPIADTDIQSFLRNERENALLAVIEETKKNTFRQAEKHFWDSMHSEWESEKQRLLNALIGSGQDLLDYAPERDSAVGDSVIMSSRSGMDHVQMGYSRQMYLFNECVVQGGLPPDILDLCTKVAKQLDDKFILDIWDMVHHMTSVPLVSTSTVAENRSSQKVQTAFVNQALRYLEKTYCQYILGYISEAQHQARLGGIPGIYPLVQAFLRIKLLPLGMPGLEEAEVDGLPLWPMVYYCMRCGDLEAALQAFNKASKDVGEVRDFLQEYMHSDQNRLSPASETKIKLQYRREARHSSDPYKRIVFCVLGNCDPSDSHSEVADKTDDYLWLKLSQVCLDPDLGAAADHTSLSDLQRQLYQDYGEVHFNAQQNPLLYFKVLLLSAQFEPALEFLWRNEALSSHAVHIAIVLFEMGLLNVPQSIGAQMLSKVSNDAEPMRRLNYARLVSLYAAKFQTTDPREALQYFYLLRKLTDSKGENLFTKCISELVTETREFEMLLGQIKEDGTRRPGAIDKFQDNTQRIIETVAKDTENKGLFEDAVKLYDLADNSEKVLELMNKLLSPLVSSPPTTHSNRDRLHNLAISIAKRYTKQCLSGTRGTTDTFYLLLDLFTFFDIYYAKDIDRALDTIEKLKLVALTPESVDDRVAGFKQYKDEIRRSMPDVLIATMNILYTKYKMNRSKPPYTPRSMTPQRGMDGGKDSYLEYLRRQAKALITFAGMLPYRMPGDINARLVQLEVLMN